MLIHNADITGSLLVNGTRFNTGSFSGSFTGIVAGTTATASYVEYNSVANKPALVSGSSQITYSGLTGIPSGIVSGSSQVTYSGLTGIPSGIVSGSAQVAGFGIFATTGSNGFNGSQSITGSLTVTGQVVAQTLNVQQVTSSIVYSSGSNIFGNSVSNTQQFTGSLQVSGSSHYLLGSVGIGSTSPLSRLHVNTGTNQNFRVRPGTDVGATNGVAINSRTDDDGSLQQLTLRASDVIMLTSGNVGINTASPSEKLEVQNGYLSTYQDLNVNDAGYGVLFYTNGGGSKNSLAAITLSQVGTARSGNLLFSTSNAGAPTTKMIITSTGNVGIGTASPDLKLSISGTAGNVTTDTGNGNLLELYGGTISSANNGVGIRFTRAGSQMAFISAARENASDEAGFLLFATQTAAGAHPERMRITSDGKVGIGIDAPSRKLQVREAGTSTSGDVVAVRNDNATSGAFINFIAGGNNAPSMGAKGNDLVFTADGYAGAERMRILTGGGITFNGDTAAANALDDYEEGTWTPELIGGGGVATYSSRYGWYTKIGRKVTIVWSIQFQKNTISTTMGMSGLPFTVLSSNTAFYPQGPVLLDSLATTTNNITFQAANNSTQGDFIGGNGGTSSHTGLSASVLGSGSMWCRGEIVYFTAS